jgi:glycosyltransferase involved in cell wall biosynthesis
LKITYVLPNVESGGTERHVLALARRIDRSRFSLSLVTTAGGGALYPDFAALIPVTVMGDPNRARQFRKGSMEQLLTIAALSHRMRRERPDIVHAYLPAANVIGPVAARLSTVPRVIVSKRSLADYKEGHPFLRQMELLGNRLADVVLVNSDAVQRDVERTERCWKGKFRKIYNGVAPIPAWTKGEAEAFRRREGFSPDGLLVLCVSNFFAYKGHDDLVEAAARLMASFPGVTFLLVGRESGALGATRSLVARLGVGGHIRFLDSRTDVPDLLRAADLFVHPSHQEGFSNAILEAMAAGLPVVACDVGGNPEAVVDGVTGRLVPPRDPTTLATAMAEILADPGKGRSMGEAGRRRAAERFSLDRMVREIEEMYESLTLRGPRGN